MYSTYGTSGSVAAQGGKLESMGGKGSHLDSLLIPIHLLRASSLFSGLEGAFGDSKLPTQTRLCMMDSQLGLVLYV